MKNIIFSAIIFGCLFFIIPVAVAQNNTSKIDFKIKNFGIYVNGNFSRVAVISNFDKDSLANSFINALVEINSIDTNNKKRDKHLLNTEYFDELNYKQLKLVSTKIEKKAANNYVLTGKLTIKKTTKTVVIPLIIDENEEGIVLSTNFELKRRDYGVGGKSWVMSNMVIIEVKHTIKITN